MHQNSLLVRNVVAQIKVSGWRSFKRFLWIWCCSSHYRKADCSALAGCWDSTWQPFALWASLALNVDGYVFRRMWVSLKMNLSWDGEVILSHLLKEGNGSIRLALLEPKKVTSVNSQKSSKIIESHILKTHFPWEGLRNMQYYQYFPLCRDMFSVFLPALDMRLHIWSCLLASVPAQQIFHGLHLLNIKRSRKDRFREMRWRESKRKKRKTSQHLFAAP